MFHHSAKVLSQSWWYQRMLMEVWEEEWGWGIRPTHKAIEQREKNDTTGGEWQAGVPPCMNHWNLHLGIKLTKGSKASPSRTSEIIGTVVQFLEYLKWRSISYFILKVGKKEPRKWEDLRPLGYHLSFCLQHMDSLRLQFSRLILDVVLFVKLKWANVMHIIVRRIYLSKYNISKMTYSLWVMILLFEVTYILSCIQWVI